MADVLEHDLREIGTGASPAAPAQALPGLISAFRSKADGVVEELAVDQPIAEDFDGWLWLHFNLADARACHFLRSASYFPLAARRLLVAANEHQQLHASDGCLYGVFPDLVCGLEGITEEIGFLHFAMTEKLLIDRRRALSGVDAQCAAEWSQGPNRAGPSGYHRGARGRRRRSLGR